MADIGIGQHHGNTNALQNAARSRKFYEGWLHIKEKGNWSKYWAVLRGQTIYFFHNDKPTQQNHVGTLYLDGQTEVKSSKSKQISKTYYKFDLYTNNPVRKCNQFRFDKENNRDVWKSFIMGVSTGLVPHDVHILPGQLKDVVEAIGEVQRTPPPLPTLPRPRVLHNKSRATSERSFGSDKSEESDTSGTFGTHITPQPRYNRSKSVPHLDGEEVTNLRALNRRQSELAVKTLGKRGERARTPEPSGGGGGRDSSDGEDYGSESAWTEFILGSQPVQTVRGHNEGMFSAMEALMSGDGSVVSGMSGRSGMSDESSPPPIPPPLSSMTTAGRDFRSDRPTSPTFGMMNSGRPSSPLPPPPPAMLTSPTTMSRGMTMQAPPRRQNSDYGSGHGEAESSALKVHQFYPDAGRNREHPPWFFENTSRELAESILTLGKRYGNVLMRESVTFKNTGSYVISMRREVAGGTQLNHYEVQKTPTGFKINVDNEHRPMKCLGEVMEFFVRQAGPGSSPMRTNNFSQLGLSAPGGGRRPVDDAPDSGVEDDDVRSNSSQPHMTTPHHRPQQAPSRPSGGHLAVSGDVPYGMGRAAHEIEYTLKKTTPQWDESRLSIPPAPPPPPPPGGIGGPPPPPPQPDYNTNRYGDHESRSRGVTAGPPPEGGFSDPNLNRTVPPRMAPSETLQRAGGHPDIYYNRGGRRPSASEEYGQRSYDGQSSVVGGPPPPPPPPMGGPPGPPPTGMGMSSPPPPPMGMGMGMSSPPPPPMGMGMGMSSPPPPPPPQPSMDDDPPAAPANSLAAMLQSATLKSADSRQIPESPGSVVGGMTTGRPRPGGFGGGAQSFEDELKKRLVAQREDVYASGATVLKSNWRDT